MQSISLLNSVIGPVMRGPSSSHTAGPFQIAATIRQLTAAAGAIRSIDVTFDPSGSFAPTYAQQSTDEGFAAGFLGLSITDDAFRGALGRLEAGDPFGLQFQTARLIPNDHPNRVQIDVHLQALDGRTRTEVFGAISTGGGMFVIDRLGDAEIEVRGTEYVVIVDGDIAATERHMAQAGFDWPAAQHKSASLAQWGFAAEPSGRQLSELAQLGAVTRVRTAAPAQFCIASTTVLLESSTVFSEDETVDLAVAALDIEGTRLGLTPKRTREAFGERRRIMLDSVARGLSGQARKDDLRFLSASAARVRAFTLPTAIGGGFLKEAIAGALAVMEEDSNRGVVVAAPTAGSAGIVPGILFALAETGAGDDELTDCLQVMALVGGVFAVRGSFAAETGGCSVETGASAAMAAGGLTYAMGGNSRQVFQAASLCLMNTMGLVCDPVEGVVEIPCHARNVAGVAHAQSAAIAVLAGFEAVLPFDELVQTTVEVGKLMHPDLRCTARAGCATCSIPTISVRI
ncbi:MAG: L-serine ammonia-lyase, iron-sulfur-dependent, subunit alpha [Mycobacterium sp.]